MLIGFGLIALTWMDKDTKIKAINKLEKISIKIGYPDKWKDYSKLNIIAVEPRRFLF